MESWNQYWDMFDKLCLSLEQRGESDLAQNLRDSQRYVNGLTDGWWDFLERFRALVVLEDKRLLPDEQKLVSTLDSTLHRALTNR